MKTLTGRLECTPPPSAVLPVGLPALHQMWGGMLRWLAIRNLRRMLHTMPDWLLRDIGVLRSEIDMIARQIVDGHDPLTLRG